MKSINNFKLINTLNHFPHIYSNIEIMWGDVEILNYLDSILMTDREDRMGLPLSVALELLEVKNYYRLIADSIKSDEERIHEILQQQSSQFK